MIQIEDIVLKALRGIYGSNITGIDVFKYSPASIGANISNRINLSGIEALLRDAGLILTVLFGVLFLITVIKLRGLSSVLKEMPEGVDIAVYPVPDGPLRSKWQNVLSQLDSPQESDWKQAVMDADKLVDLALSNAGIPGAGIGERLLNAGTGRLESLDGIWWAHKVRNRLAHEIGYSLRYPEAKQAIGYYERTLNELEAI